MEPHEFERGWHGGLPETPCGFGSKLSETVIQRKVLADWIAQYSVFSIVDVGAGDLNWIRHMDWPHAVAYTPLDLVPRHPDVRQFDLVHSAPPKADMTLCLWVLNHLPEESAKRAAENLLKNTSLLVYTWWPAMPDYLDFGCMDAVVIRPRIKAELRLLECT